MLVLDEFRSSQHNDFDATGEPARVSEYAHIALFSFFPILVWMRFWWMKMKIRDRFSMTIWFLSRRTEMWRTICTWWIFFFLFNESRDRGSSDRDIERNAKKVKLNWNKEGRGGRSDGRRMEWIERRNRGAWSSTKRVTIRMSRWCLLRQWAFSRFK